MLGLVLFSFISIFGTTVLSEPTLKPFQTDGCSGWNNGTRREPKLWLECCIKHDYAYWIGGTEEQRYEADRKFRKCVRQKSNFLTAFVMYIGVRIGGSPDFETDYRWGYGWNSPRGYKALTPKEQKNVQSLSSRAKQNLQEALLKSK